MCQVVAAGGAAGWGGAEGRGGEAASGGFWEGPWGGLRTGLGKGRPQGDAVEGGRRREG